jgi:hypothetical protein
MTQQPYEPEAETLQPPLTPAEQLLREEQIAADAQAAEDARKGTTEASFATGVEQTGLPVEQTGPPVEQTVPPVEQTVTGALPFGSIPTVKIQPFTGGEQQDMTVAEYIATLALGAPPGETVASNTRHLQNLMLNSMAKMGADITLQGEAAEVFKKLLANVSHEIILEKDLHRGTVLDALYRESIRIAASDDAARKQKARISTFQSQYTTTFITPLLTLKGNLLKDVDKLLMVAAFQAALPTLTLEYEDIYAAKLAKRTAENKAMLEKQQLYAEGIEDLGKAFDLDMAEFQIAPEIPSRDIQFSMDDFFQDIKDSSVEYMHSGIGISPTDADEMEIAISASVQAWAKQANREAAARDRFRAFVSRTFTTLNTLVQNTTLELDTRNGVGDMISEMASGYDMFEDLYIADTDYNLGGFKAPERWVDGINFLTNIYSGLEEFGELAGTYVEGDPARSVSNVSKRVASLALFETELELLNAHAIISQGPGALQITDEAKALATEKLRVSPEVGWREAMRIAKAELEELKPSTAGKTDPVEQEALFDAYLNAYLSVEAKYKDFPQSVIAAMRLQIKEHGARAYDVLELARAELAPGVLDKDEQLQIFDNVLKAANNTPFAAIYTDKKKKDIRDAINDGAPALMAISLHTGNAPGTVNEAAQHRELATYMAVYHDDPDGLARDFPPDAQEKIQRVIENGGTAQAAIAYYKTKPAPGETNKIEELNSLDTYLKGLTDEMKAILLPDDTLERIKNRINDGAQWGVAYNSEKNQLGSVDSYNKLHPEGTDKAIDQDILSAMDEAIKGGVSEDEALAWALGEMGDKGKKLAFLASARLMISDAGMLASDSEGLTDDVLFAIYEEAMGPNGSKDPYTALRSKVSLLGGRSTFLARARLTVEDAGMSAEHTAEFTDKFLLGLYDTAWGPEGNKDPDAYLASEMGDKAARNAFLARARRTVADADMSSKDTAEFTDDFLFALFDKEMGTGGGQEPFEALTAAIGNKGSRSAFLANQKRIIADMDLIAEDAARFGSDEFILGIWDGAMGINGTQDPTGNMASALADLKSAGTIGQERAVFANVGVPTDVHGEPLEFGRPESLRLAEEERARIFTNDMLPKFGLQSLEGLSENVQAFAKGTTQVDIKGALEEMLSAGSRGHRILKEFGGTAEDFVKLAMEGGVNPVTGQKYVAATRPSDILASLATLLDETEEEALRLGEKDQAVSDAMEAAGLDLGSLPETDRKDLGQLEQAHLQSAKASPEFANIPEEEKMNGFVRDALSRSGRSFTPGAESVGLRRRKAQGFELSDEEIDTQTEVSLFAKDEFKGMSSEELREKQRSAFESARANRREKERRAMTTLSQRDLPEPIEAKPRPRRKRPVSA